MSSSAAAERTETLTAETFQFRKPVKRIKLIEAVEEDLKIFNIIKFIESSYFFLCGYIHT